VQNEGIPNDFYSWVEKQGRLDFEEDNHVISESVSFIYPGKGHSHCRPRNVTSLSQEEVKKPLTHL